MYIYLYYAGIGRRYIHFRINIFDFLSGLVNKARLDLIRFENYRPHPDTNRDEPNTETVGNIKSSYFIPNIRYIKFVISKLSAEAIRYQPQLFITHMIITKSKKMVLIRKGCE